MARIPLIHIPLGIYSVVSKCNNDEFHFDAAEKFDFYLRHLLQCKRKLGFLLYDVCCMSNHVHELYRVPEDVTIASILQRVKGDFSRLYNQHYGRSGHFWRNKPFYRIVQNEQYALHSCHYYHENPVRAGIVKHPWEWPYSGYRFHMLGDRSGLLGALLNAIPGYTCEQWQHTSSQRLIGFDQQLQRVRNRFIGEETYRRQMKLRFRPFG